MSKKNLIILGIETLILFGIALYTLNESIHISTSNQTIALMTSAAAQTAASTAKSTKSINPNAFEKVSMNKFNQIKNGMSYEEVAAIIGNEGEVLSESGFPSDSNNTILYKWNGEGDFGANANFMFQKGKLINKAQFGLK